MGLQKIILHSNQLAGSTQGLFNRRQVCFKINIKKSKFRSARTFKINERSASNGNTFTVLWVSANKAELFDDLPTFWLLIG